MKIKVWVLVDKKGRPFKDSDKIPRLYKSEALSLWNKTIEYDSPRQIILDTEARARSKYWG